MIVIYRLTNTNHYIAIPAITIIEKLIAVFLFLKESSWKHFSSEHQSQKFNGAEAERNLLQHTVLL